MLNRKFTIGAFAAAAFFSASVGAALAEDRAGHDKVAFAEDLTSPLPVKNKQPAKVADDRAGEPGAIEGSLEERYAKFQAEQKKRIKHFQDVVNRNHMKKYGEKVR